jgi:hypothetical protein
VASFCCEGFGLNFTTKTPRPKFAPAWPHWKRSPFKAPRPRPHRGSIRAGFRRHSTLNSLSELSETLARVRLARPVAEMIVANGGSRNGTQISHGLRAAG